MTDLDLQFSTEFNYQKIFLSDKRSDVVGVGTTNITIPHNLGYIPSVRIWYDPELGIRTPISSWQISELNSVGMRAYLTTNTLELQISNTATTKTIDTWYRIYYDA